MEKGDLAATFSLNVTNPYGFQVLCKDHVIFEKRDIKVKQAS